MGTGNFLWNLSKRYFTVGLIGLTVSDRYFSIVPIHGSSMSPTFNSHVNNSKGPFLVDHVLVEKFCLEKYKFSRGDVVVFRSPTNYKEKHVKRLIGLPGDCIYTPHYDVVVVPEGHCWVEGDNSALSLDSRSLGPIPLGLVRGRATHIVWPPRRICKVDGGIPQERLLV